MQSGPADCGGSNRQALRRSADSDWTQPVAARAAKAGPRTKVPGASRRPGELLFPWCGRLCSVGGCAVLAETEGKVGGGVKVARWSCSGPHAIGAAQPHAVCTHAAAASADGK